tara:strand:+ start:432 stop:566 length:135 start_codon:yes stop_codon:yes gene_type:complete
MLTTIIALQGFILLFTFDCNRNLEMGRFFSMIPSSLAVNEGSWI